MSYAVALLAADTAAGVAARRAGLQLATIACYVWFSLAFMFGKGSPFLNYWLYPLAGVLSALYLLPVVVLGRAPINALGAGPTFADPALVVAVGEFFLPGVLVGLVLVGAFIAVRNWRGRADAWIDRHLPAAYREIQREVDPEAAEEYQRQS